jgi:hypothetical protein
MQNTKTIFRRKKNQEKACERAGLPDFSPYLIPKPEKNLPKGHKMHQMVIKYLKCP